MCKALILIFSTTKERKIEKEREKKKERKRCTYITLNFLVTTLKYSKKKQMKLFVIMYLI
jgi:hypothetical protein